MVTVISIQFVASLRRRSIRRSRWKKGISSIMVELDWGGGGGGGGLEGFFYFFISGIILFCRMSSEIA